MSTGLRLSAERRRLVEQLGPDDLALLARALRYQDNPGGLERLAGRGDGQEKPEVLVEVQGDDDVVHVGRVGRGRAPLRHIDRNRSRTRAGVLSCLPLGRRGPKCRPVRREFDCRWLVRTRLWHTGSHGSSHLSILLGLKTRRAGFTFCDSSLTFREVRTVCPVKTHGPTNTDRSNHDCGHQTPE